MTRDERQPFPVAGDPLLAPLFEARDEEARQRALESIVLRHAQPVARRVLARYRSGHSSLTRADLEDILATVHLRLVRKLRAVAAFEDEAVLRLEDYVVTLTYNAVYDVLRARVPDRARLKKRLRYLLASDPRFVTWRLPSGVACGLAAWQGAPPRLVANSLHAADWDEASLRADAPAEAVLLLLSHVNGPVLLDDLVSILVEVWRVGEPQRGSGEETALLQPASDPEARDAIASVWREILELPANQRAALLLNLRDGDGGNAITLFVLLGIATIDEVAAALDLTAEALAEVWNELPLDDLRIADLLQLKRQQIINLRKSARARLSRRVGKGKP